MTEWQLVPKEPTLEMQRAYFDEIDRNMSRVQTDLRFGRHDNHELAYKAMLAASPTPADDGRVREIAEIISDELNLHKQGLDWADRYGPIQRTALAILASLPSTPAVSGEPLELAQKIYDTMPIDVPKGMSIGHVVAEQRRMGISHIARALAAALPASPAVGEVVEALSEVVKAWDGLKAGYYDKDIVETWLIQKMKPAITAARVVLGQPNVVQQLDAALSCLSDKGERS